MRGSELQPHLFQPLSLHLVPRYTLVQLTVQDLTELQTSHMLDDFELLLRRTSGRTDYNYYRSCSTYRFAEEEATFGNRTVTRAQLLSFLEFPLISFP